MERHQAHPLAQVMAGVSGAALIGAADKAFDITKYEDSSYIYIGYAVWFLGSWIIYRSLERKLLGRLLETLLVVIALLGAAYLLVQDKSGFYKIWIETEKQRVDSTNAHLYRAINESTRPYTNSWIRDRFTDRTHRYHTVNITLYDVQNAGIIEYELDGFTTSYREDGLIRFPFGANVELPHEAHRYLLIEDLKQDPARPLDFELTPIPTDFRTYLYEAAIPEFQGDLHYRRVFCHPTSQTFNPEAFLILLDLFESEIDELNITLLSDKPLAKVLLQAPSEYIHKKGEFEWRDRATPFKEGKITDPEILSNASRRSSEDWGSQDSLYGPVEFVGGFSYSFKKPTRERLFLIYLKGQTDTRQFL